MQRLKTRAQFQAVLAGSIVAKTAHFALHCSSLHAFDAADATSKPGYTGEVGRTAPLFRQPGMWIGAMVPKRWAKRAVTRNAIKRQIYAVGNGLCKPYPNSAYVVRLRSGFAKSEFASAVSEPLRQAVRAEIQTLMEKGIRLP